MGEPPACSALVLPRGEGEGELVFAGLSPRCRQSIEWPLGGSALVDVEGHPVARQELLNGLVGAGRSAPVCAHVKRAIADTDPVDARQPEDRSLVPVLEGQQLVVLVARSSHDETPSEKGDSLRTAYHPVALGDKEHPVLRQSTCRPPEGMAGPGRGRLRTGR